MNSRHYSLATNYQTYLTQRHKENKENLTQMPPINIFQNKESNKYDGK